VCIKTHVANVVLSANNLDNVYINVWCGANNKPKNIVSQNPLRYGSLSFGEGRGEVKKLVTKAI
jgi:hypothetical protein